MLRVLGESGNDERQPDSVEQCKIITAGATFTSFEEFKASLDHLKETQFHPFRVFNSQTECCQSVRQLENW